VKEVVIKIQRRSRLAFAMKKTAGFQMNQGCGGEDSLKGLGEERGIRGGFTRKKKASSNSLSRALEKKG
jgi:hypothetical protein